MFKDLDIFWYAAQAILASRDPYSIPSLEVFYPLPFYLLFVPWVALPLPLVHVVWTVLQLAILVLLARRSIVYFMLSMPVLLTFILGQVDIVMAGLFLALRAGVGGGIALALLVLKPQLALLLTPWLLWHWWRHDRRQILLFVLVLGLLVLGAFAAQPDWLARFFARSGERTRAGISSSIWGMTSFMPTPLWILAAGAIAAALVVWAWRRNDFDLVAAVGLFISPFIFSYNLLPLYLLVRRKSFLIGLTCVSWVAFALSAWLVSDGPSALIAAGAIGALAWTARREAG